MRANRCIPYRWTKDNIDQMGETEEIIEVLMVTSPKRDDLVFPKVLDIVYNNSLHQHETLHIETFHFVLLPGWMGG